MYQYLNLFVCDNCRTVSDNATETAAYLSTEGVLGTIAAVTSDDAESTNLATGDGLSRELIRSRPYEKLRSFSSRFAETVTPSKTWFDLDDGVQDGSMTNTHGMETIQRTTEDAVDQSTKFSAGEKVTAGLDKSYSVEPTVRDCLLVKASVANEEAFVPIAPITTFGNYDEVISRGNCPPLDLADYVLSDNLRVASRACGDFEVGRIVVNEMFSAIAEAQFDEVKESRMDRGSNALMPMTA